MTTTTNDQPVERRCWVCRAPRPVPDMADAIAHAPCDQRMALEYGDAAEPPGFWASVGWAGYDAS